MFHQFRESQIENMIWKNDKNLTKIDIDTIIMFKNASQEGMNTKRNE